MAPKLEESGYKYQIRKSGDRYEAVLFKDGYEKYISETMPWYHPRVLPSLITGKVVRPS